jgi:hypothetical protein
MLEALKHWRGTHVDTYRGQEGRIDMTRKFVTPLVVAVFAAASLVMPVEAQRLTRDTAGVTVPFSAVGVSNGGNVDVSGTFTINQFAAVNDQLMAIGTLAATVTDGAGTRTVITQKTVPVSVISSGAPATAAAFGAQRICEILHLELGPLDLDLLGLLVHLDKVVLDISAESGPGNLLGNLLCAIAGLLDSGPLPTILDQLVSLLNAMIVAL